MYEYGSKFSPNEQKHNKLAIIEGNSMTVIYSHVVFVCLRVFVLVAGPSSASDCE